MANLYRQILNELFVMVDFNTMVKRKRPQIAETIGLYEKSTINNKDERLIDYSKRKNTKATKGNHNVIKTKKNAKI